MADSQRMAMNRTATMPTDEGTKNAASVIARAWRSTAR